MIMAASEVKTQATRGSLGAKAREERKAKKEVWRSHSKKRSQKRLEFHYLLRF